MYQAGVQIASFPGPRAVSVASTADSGLLATRAFKPLCVDSQSQCFASNHRNSARDVERFACTMYGFFFQFVDV